MNIIHNPSYPCSCRIEQDGKAMSIVYCSLHAAARDLLRAAKLALNTPACGSANLQPNYAEIERSLRVAVMRAEAREQTSQEPPGRTRIERDAPRGPQAPEPGGARNQGNQGPESAHQGGR